MLSDYIYENSKEILLKGFDDSKEQEEILYFYKEYLDKLYSSNVKNIDEYEKLKDRFLKLEISKWSSIPKGVKQGLLIRDEFLNRLGYLSDLGLKYAISKLKGESIDLTEEQAKKYISDMKLLVDKVRDFNSDLAKTYLSEGILDFMYASGLTNNKSLRVGRMR